MTKEFTWSDVSISQFEEIVSISGMRINDLDKAIEILSVMTGETSEYYKALPVPQFREQISRISGLKVSELKPRFESGIYSIDGFRYNLTPNAERMAAGQFIDYQMTVENDPNNIAMLCAILLIPEGKKYGEGYHVPDLAKMIYEKFPYIDAMGISFFLKKTLDALSAATLYSSIRRMKKQRKKEKDPGRRITMQAAIRKTQQAAKKILDRSGIV